MRRTGGAPVIPNPSAQRPKGSRSLGITEIGTHKGSLGRGDVLLKINIEKTITTKSVDKTANLSCPLKYQMFTRSVSLP